MKLLFDNALAPLTYHIGFLQVGVAQLAAGYAEWMEWLVAVNMEIKDSHTQKPMTGTLYDVLQTLPPLTEIENKIVFVPTASNWTAIFVNFWRGDLYSKVAHLARRLGCRGINMMSVPVAIDERAGNWRTLGIQVFGPQKPNIISNMERVIGIVRDNNRLRLVSNGTPFPFERLDQYQAKRVKDRFTQDLLEQYMAEFGLFPFDESFYMPAGGGPAILDEKQYPSHVVHKTYTIDEIRIRLKL